MCTHLHKPDDRTMGQLLLGQDERRQRGQQLVLRGVAPVLRARVQQVPARKTGVSTLLLAATTQLVLTSQA